ncbi:MAG TPA: hypothetical protein VIM00_02525 [Candidatus Acidoferrum sp.]
MLTLFGYLSFLAGAMTMWRGREDVSLWLHSEAGVFRRNLSRYTAVGPFYSPRDESRLKLIPGFVVGSISRMPRALVARCVVLLLAAPVLVLLDLFF